MKRLQAWLAGFRDGLETLDLSTGLTFGDERDELYDSGVNAGQWIRRRLT